MSPIYVPGKVTLAQQQKIPVVIGEPWGGGYFAGYISHTADGNPTHALIVAPAATGATGTSYTLTDNLAWKTTNTTTAGTTSDFDGAANTAAIVTAGIADHPAAQFCVNLSIGGFTDWYLPSRYELDIAYFNLKPTSANNDTTAGVNVYAVPQRSNSFSVSYPSITTVALFASSEAFVSAYHWSSTEASSSTAGILRFDTGFYLTAGTSKTNNTLRTRAFRRIEL
jgi:hypothetical protein